MIQKFYYKIVFRFCKIEQRKCKFNVSLCAIFKDEADYLKEWIEFHRIVGVEHFYMAVAIQTVEKGNLMIMR